MSVNDENCDGTTEKLALAHMHDFLFAIRIHTWGIGREKHQLLSAGKEELSELRTTGIVMARTKNLQ